MFNRILAALVVVAALAGCGNASGGRADSFLMDVTTTAVRVQDDTNKVYRYDRVTVVNLGTTPLKVGGPNSRELLLCNDAACGNNNSATLLSGDVWLESTSGTISNVQIAPVSF